MCGRGPSSTTVIEEPWAFRAICPTWGGVGVLRGFQKGWGDPLPPPWTSPVLKIAQLQDQSLLPAFML